MPTDDNRLRHLPEPAELHAQLSKHYPLDWGDPIRDTAGLIAEYELGPTTRSLELLQDAARHHFQVTSHLISAIHPGDVAHQLESRVKSPASLARKLWSYEKLGHPAPTDDLLRFTVVTGSPETLVGSALGTTDRLAAQGWRVESAHQSYVDGSRYKGLHAIVLNAEGHQVEVQFHTPESIRIKTQTTVLYMVERDPRQPMEVRRDAQSECIRLSATMVQPPGIDGLSELQGVAVAPRRYGARIRQNSDRQSSPAPNSERAPGATRQQTRQTDNDRMIT